tara:strand:- start:1826 stop:3247 length:1422 start_codon:yes stop_codon:yes gene_type:complete
MVAKKEKQTGPLAPLGSPGSTVPETTTTTTLAPMPVTGERIKAIADWVQNRAATYVAIGLTPAAADKKALADSKLIDVGTADAPDPFDVMPSVNLEAPGAAKKQLDAFAKAKLDPRTNRWKVPGYGLYSEQDYSNTLAALKINAAKDPGSIVSNTSKTKTKQTTKKTTEKVVDKTSSDKWKKIIQEEFGSLWDVYNSDLEVKKVIDDAVKGGYQDDENKMNAKLQNTSWYRTTQQSARQWAVQQSTDPATAESRVVASIEEIRTNASSQGFTLDDVSLRKLATDSIKFGWDSQQKLNALGSEQVANAQLGGAQGMADLRQSFVGRNLRAKAAAFFQKPSEELISSFTQQILLGQKSEVQFEEAMRDSARTQFRSLQPALDKGQDVDTAMYAYKQQAESILGSSIDPTQIDWTQDKWNKALNFQDAKTGEYRQMDLWEWNKYLRTLPEWQNTNEAKSAYGDLAISLARGFGKTA